jgi:hypothetical protein
MAALGAITVLVLAGGCGDDADEPTTTTAIDDETTTPSGPETTTTTIAPAVTTTTGGAAGLEPGDPCSIEEGHPDCIDPDGDGEGTYLIGGADCMAALPDSPELCTDLDGDGVAGYPDSG